MDEFFSSFSDEAFGETKTPKSAPKLTSYNAKICSAEWFLDDSVVSSDEANSKDGVDLMMIRKYRGDRFYLLGKYSDAIDEFRLCEVMIPMSNPTVLRDIIEAKVRCALRLGLNEDVRRDMKKLLALATNANTRLAFLHLQLELLRGGPLKRKGEFKISRTADTIKSTVVETLQRLVSLLPLSAELWIGLYKALFERDEDEEGQSQKKTNDYEKLRGAINGHSTWTDDSETSSDRGPRLDDGDPAYDSMAALSTTPPTLSHETRKALCLRCLLWAKLCLQTDFPSLVAFKENGGGDDVGDGDGYVENDDEDGERNFALGRSRLLLTFVEAELATAVRHGGSGGGKEYSREDIGSVTATLSVKFLSLSSFDDHAKEVVDAAFYKRFFDLEIV